MQGYDTASVPMRRTGLSREHFACYGRMRLLGLFFALLLCVSCDGMGSSERVEVSRVASPDGALDAVLVRTNGGATTGFVFEVFLVPGGRDVSEGDSAVLAFDRTDVLSTEWDDEHRLTFILEGGRVLHFRSSKYVSTAPGGLREVESRLVHRASEERASAQGR